MFKRLFEQASFIARVVIAYVLIASLVIVGVAAARHFKVPLWLSVPIGLATPPALLALWGFGKVVLWATARVTRALWKFRVFRWAVWSSYALGAAVLAVLIFRSDRLTPFDEWKAIDAEMAARFKLAAFAAELVGLTAFHAALLIAGPPTRLEEAWMRLRQRLEPHWNRRFAVLRVILWVVAVAFVDTRLYAAVEGCLGDNWVAAPWAWSERYRVPLPFLAPAVFTFAAFFARPFYFRRAPPRWVYGIWTPSPARRELNLRMFGRIPLRVFGRVRKRVSTILSDGRQAEAGERFVFVRVIWTGVAFSTLASVAAFSWVAAGFVEGLPSDLSSIVAYQPVVSTVVYDRHDRRMCTFTLEDRDVIPLEEIPQHVQDAFMAAEDKNFSSHQGIDPVGIIRAAKSNFEGGADRQGASTLTQQLIKQLVLKDSSKSYTRKLSEIFLAVRLEKEMADKYGGRKAAKREIIAHYLNHVYLGNGKYGIKTAAQDYFAKRPDQLTLAEAAILAGLPKAPARDSPQGHFGRAKVRQRYVLGRMLELGKIAKAEYDAARVEHIAIIQRSHQLNATAAPFDCENVRKWAESTFGQDAVYKRGLSITTTFDLDIQEKAQAAVRYGLLDLERRLGFAGPEGRDEKAGDRCDGPASWIADNTVETNARVVARDGKSITLCARGGRFPLDAEDVARVERWEKAGSGRSLRVADIISVRIETRHDDKGAMIGRFALSARRTGGEKHPEALQSALVAIEPASGEIRAIVGGYDWNESQYDGATQAHRQTGSSIKPYIYLSALIAGRTVTSSVLDAPICLDTATGPWCPANYSGPHTSRVYYGDVDLVTALAKSLNSVSVRLIKEVGLDAAIGTMRDLGIKSEIVRVYPIAVGSPELTLLEHTAAYASILSNGKALPVQHLSGAPGRFITKVTARVFTPGGGIETKVVYAVPKPVERQAAPSCDAYAITHLMKGVVQFGTGQRAKRLRRPVAGKTGTTNDFKDAWFMGGTADLTVGVWVGRMNPSAIAKEATGGSVALPIWIGFMEAVFPAPAPFKKGEKVSLDPPARDFPIPDDVTLANQGKNDDGLPVLVPFQRGKAPEKNLSAPAADFGQGVFN